MIMLSDKSDFSYEMDDKKINHKIKKGFPIIKLLDTSSNLLFIEYKAVYDAILVVQLKFSLYHMMSLERIMSGGNFSRVVNMGILLSRFDSISG
jgi:hypothetical protein